MCWSKIVNDYEVSKELYDKFLGESAKWHDKIQSTDLSDLRKFNKYLSGFMTEVEQLSEKIDAVTQNLPDDILDTSIDNQDAIRIRQQQVDLIKGKLSIGDIALPENPSEVLKEIATDISSKIICTKTKGEYMKMLEDYLNEVNNIEESIKTNKETIEKLEIQKNIFANYIKLLNELA